MSKMDFAALLCSRLCHDLVSPVGAISNGIEILNEEHDASMREQVMDLLQKSAQQTGNKLQFFRLAFGAAGGFSAQLDIREAEKAIDAFLDGTRVTAEFELDLPDVPKGVVKVLLNIVLVASETLIRGGVLRVSIRQEGGDINIVVEAEGDRFILQDVVRSAIEGTLEEIEIEPRSAPAYLVAQVVSEMNGKFELEDVSDTLHRFKVQLPVS